MADMNANNLPKWFSGITESGAYTSGRERERERVQAGNDELRLFTYDVYANSLSGSRAVSLMINRPSESLIVVRDIDARALRKVALGNQSWDMRSCCGAADHIEWRPHTAARRKATTIPKQLYCSASTARSNSLVCVRPPPASQRARERIKNGWPGAFRGTREKGLRFVSGTHPFTPPPHRDSLSLVSLFMDHS